MKKIKIGILTFHRAYNNGAFLQAYALCSRLNKESFIEAEIIDFQMKKERDAYSVLCYPIKKAIRRILDGTYYFYWVQEKEFKKALKYFDPIKTKEHVLSDNITDFQNMVRNRYDVIITGSDEVWKVNGIRGFPNPYWLIGELGCRKYSYAVSARVDFQSVLNADELRILKDALSCFDFISVRDEKTREMLMTLNVEGKEIHKCCDPTFLYDIDVPPYPIQKTLERKSTYQKNKKNLLVLVNDDTVVRTITKELKDEYNIISTFIPHKDCINLSKINPFEWVGLIKSVDFVITTLYHGACFCILNGTPFLALDTREEQDSKLQELLSDEVTQNRYYSAISQSINFRELVPMLSVPTDYSSYIEEKRATFKWMLTSLYHSACTEGEASDATVKQSEND